MRILLGRGSMNVNNSMKYTALLLLSAALTGVSGSVMKFGYSDVPPLLFLTYRFLFGFVILVLVFRKNILKNFKRSDLRPIAVISFFMAFGFVLFTLGLKYTTATNATFFYSLTVLMIPFLAYLINGSKFNKEIFVGILIAVAGMYLLIMNEGTFQINLGDLLSLLSALVFAFHVVFTGKFVSRVNPMALSVIQLFMVMVFVFLVSILIGEELSPPVYPARVWFTFLFTGIAGTAVFTLVQTVAQIHVKESTVGMVYATIPMFTAFSAWFVLGETLSLTGKIGCGLITLGIILAARMNKSVEA